MDNYFTSVPLFKLLRERGYGACGTTRPTSKDFPSQLQQLRKDSSSSIPWGKTYAMVVDNVLCLVWQDNNLVLALSTVHYPTNVIERLRKRPKKTSINAGIVLKICGSDVTKKLPIPTFIDDYNHQMNRMVVVNQMRASYTPRIVTERNLLLILYWSSDTSIVNSLLIQ